MNVPNTTTDHKRWSDIEDAKAELHGCAAAISAAACAFAAATSVDTPVIDGNEAYELLICIHQRQARALTKLDDLVIDGLHVVAGERQRSKSPPA